MIYMNEKEKILNKLRLSLGKKVHETIDNMSRIDEYYVLNSSITKNSDFEKNPLISKFTIYNLEKVPLAEMLLEDQKIEMDASVEFLASKNIPKIGKELNYVSSAHLYVKIYAEVKYNQHLKEIEIHNIIIR